jgi:long-chain acyl-CoA synthetase
MDGGGESSAGRPWLARYEREVPASPEIPPVTLHALFYNAVRDHEVNAATLLYGERAPYSLYGDHARRFAYALHTLPMERGDRVALMMPNGPQFLPALFGTLEAGGVVVMINPALQGDELAGVLRESGARVLVTMRQGAARLKEAVAASPVRHLVLADIQNYLSPFGSMVLAMRERRPPTGPLQPPELDGWGDVVTHSFIDLVRTSVPEQPQEEQEEVQPGDLAVIIYTEGVSGAPKAVEMTHRNLIANTTQLSAWLWDVRPERRDVFLAAAPFHTGYGLVTGLLVPLSAGATVALVPRATPRDLVRTIARSRPTVFPATPALLEGLAAHPLAQRTDLRSLRVCLSSGSHLAPETARTVQELTGAQVNVAYGLAEATALTHCSPIYGESREGSAGLPLPLTDALIIDAESGEEVPVGEVGELAVRGPQVVGDEGRWLHTGDMARRDEDGFFYVLERGADVIEIEGKAVYPREIEAVLAEHPKVQEALVVGGMGDDGKAIITAYVVLRDDADAFEGELLRFCRERLPMHAVPTHIEFREDLPRSALGKPIRRQAADEE